MGRIYLSPPHLSGREMELIRDAVASNWIAPLGPHVDAFEREFIETLTKLQSENAEVRAPECEDSIYAVALSSGTAALHLALRILTGSGGWGPGDQGRGMRDDGLGMCAGRSNEVLCPTLTFSASANVITYDGGVPVFIDSDPTSWNMDPGLLREELEACAARGKLPRAVIAVDLYGQCADYDAIVQACAEFEVPLIEDAAEALGATYWGGTAAKARETPLSCMQWASRSEDRGQESSPSDRGSGGQVSSQSCETEGRDEAEARAMVEGQAGREPGSYSTSALVRSAGSFGAAAAFSFNGNKIITTSGGGMLVSHDKAIVDKARFLATQARDPVPHYRHTEIGFNYRMSNILAAIGRGQLEVLPQRVAARRRNFDFYQQALGDVPGIEFMPEASFGRSTRWLTCLTIDPEKFGANRRYVRLALERENIESRPVWRPMHLQPVFKDCRVRGGSVAENLYERGLCLPSGSALTEEDLARICGLIRKVHERTVRPCLAAEVMSEKRPGRVVVSEPDTSRVASSTGGK
jgi:dTDP-4-amino-4,6-dideoxygalactose transaminase